MGLWRNRDKKNRYLNDQTRYERDSKVAEKPDFWSAIACEGKWETFTPSYTAAPISIKIK